jgi:hypothetical protein
VKRILGSRAAPAAIIAIAIALAAPSVTTGLSADDWVHEVIAEGRALEGMPRSRLDLFTFADGDPRHIHALIDQGMFPWWADDHVRLAFARPLAALTHLVDFALWPRAPWAMHVHNLAWFALALAAVWMFYRRFATPPWVAALALLLYAIDDAHGPAVGWVANRNAMIALALGLPAVALHDRWRRDAWRPGAWLAPLVLAIGLLAGESAIAVVAYLAAHALVFEPAGERSGGGLREPAWRRALMRVTPLWRYAVVLVAWRAVYAALGYGANGSGIYLDPAHDAGPFLAALPSRAAALLAGQLALPWSDFASLYEIVSPALALKMTLIAAATVALLAATFAGVVRRDPVARFFALGLLFAVVPIASTFPADRLLWFVGVGAMGLLARFFAAPKSWPLRAMAVLLLLIHVVLAAPLLAIRARSMETVEKPLARANDSLPRTPDVAGKTVVIVNPPADLFVGYVQVTRAARGEPRPARIRWLATGGHGVEVEREDARTLRVRPARGFVESSSETMLRSRRRPFTAGWTRALTGVTVEVVAVTPDGRPAEARFRFDVPLDDPSLVWMQWRGRGYVPFEVPAVGARVSLEPIDFLAAVFQP